MAEKKIIHDYKGPETDCHSEEKNVQISYFVCYYIYILCYELFGGTQVLVGF